jgi:hypothetical protein
MSNFFLFASVDYLFCSLIFIFLYGSFHQEKSTLTIEGEDGYYQETRWEIPLKTTVIISGTNRANTILSVGLPVGNSFINCVSGLL